MKNLIKCLAACLLLPVMVAAGNPLPILTVVEGHVFNQKAVPESKTIIINIPDITGMRNNTVYFTQLDKNNNFKIILKQYVTQEAQLIQEGIQQLPLIQNFIIHPGDKIHINLDFKDIMNISFSGSAANTNNALFNYIKTVGRLFDFYDRSKLYNIHEPDKFKAAVSAVKTDLQQKVFDFEEKVHANAETKTWLTNYINIGCSSWLASFYVRNHVEGTGPMAFSGLTVDNVNETNI